MLLTLRYNLDLNLYPAHEPQVFALGGRLPDPFVEQLRVQGLQIAAIISRVYRMVMVLFIYFSFSNRVIIFFNIQLLVCWVGLRPTQQENHFPLLAVCC